MQRRIYTVDVQPPSSDADAEWDSFVAAHASGHLLQTSNWARLKARFGWDASRVLARRGGRLEAGAQVLFRRYAGGLIAYVPKGPLVDWGSEPAVDAVFGGIRELARHRTAVFVKVEPNLPQSEATGRVLGRLGYRPEARTVQPRSTILIDIARPEDAVLQSMKPKWRYNVRLAERRGVQVRSALPDEMAQFYELSRTTSSRDGFPIHGRAYYDTAYAQFVPAGLGQLLLATYEGMVLAGIMVFALGRTAWYMYGASSDSHRNLMPNHLLQWEAIRWARSRGCTEYDLWGIPDEVGRSPAQACGQWGRSRGLWGVYRFKEGFGGRVVRWAGAFDHVLNAPFYWLGNTAWPLVRQVAQLLTRRRTAAEASPDG